MPLAPACVLDFERGRGDRLTPYPWLTDTSIGPWCQINGEAICGTRPWLVYGEGPTHQGKGGRPNIGFWDKPDERAHWLAWVPKAGSYAVRAELSAGYAPSRLKLEIAGQSLVAQVPKIAWFKPQMVPFAQVEIAQPGGLPPHPGACRPQDLEGGERLAARVGPVGLTAAHAAHHFAGAKRWNSQIVGPSVAFRMLRRTMRAVTGSNFRLRFSPSVVPRAMVRQASPSLH